MLKANMGDDSSLSVIYIEAGTEEAIMNGTVEEVCLVVSEYV